MDILNDVSLLLESLRLVVNVLDPLVNTVLVRFAAGAGKDFFQCRSTFMALLHNFSLFLKRSSVVEFSLLLLEIVYVLFALLCL